MITRVALFEGTVKPNQTEVFRAAVKDLLVPLWMQFSGKLKER